MIQQSHFKQIIMRKVISKMKKRISFKYSVPCTKFKYFYCNKKNRIPDHINF